MEKSLYLKIIERLFVKFDRDLYSGYSTRCPLNGSIIIIIDTMDNLNQFESIAIFFYPRYKSRKYKKKILIVHGIVPGSTKLAVENT